MKNVWMVLLCGGLLLATPKLLAWGPHDAITRAALDALGPQAPIVRLLGAKAASQLTDYCWMGDKGGLLFHQGGASFYSDDYLIFPGMINPPAHMVPGATETYRPYFLRSLQALRTEPPIHAARWIGSLLHFLEDSGAPPHAAGISGPLHHPMEAWVKDRAIRLPGYQPRLLGRTDEEALAAYEKRMQELIAFAQERARRVRPFVAARNRSASEPIILESALECSKVVADVLHTLGHLAPQKKPGQAWLRGKITAANAPGLEHVAAKVLLLDTLYSTVCDAEGRFEFHHLPAGNYTLAVLRAGSRVLTTNVVTQPSPASPPLLLNLTPTRPAGNLLRNPDFEIRWANTNKADCWHRQKLPDGPDFWTSERLPVTPGGVCQIDAAWRPDVAGPQGEIWVRWMTFKRFADPHDVRVLKPGETSKPLIVPAGYNAAQILVKTDRNPAEFLRRLSFVPLRKK